MFKKFLSRANSLGWYRDSEENWKNAWALHYQVNVQAQSRLRRMFMQGSEGAFAVNINRLERIPAPQGWTPPAQAADR